MTRAALTLARRCTDCGTRLGQVTWCPLCHAPTGGGLRRELVPGRSSGGSHERVDWRRVHRSSLWRATSTSFGAPTKVALTVPAWVVPAYWWWAGAFHDGMLALVLGVPQVLVALWWTAQVWRQRGRLLGR